MPIWWHAQSNWRWRKRLKAVWLKYGKKLGFFVCWWKLHVWIRLSGDFQPFRLLLIWLNIAIWWPNCNTFYLIHLSFFINANTRQSKKHLSVVFTSPLVGLFSHRSNSRPSDKNQWRTKPPCRVDSLPVQWCCQTPAPMRSAAARHLQSDSFTSPYISFTTSGASMNHLWAPCSPHTPETLASSCHRFPIRRELPCLPDEGPGGSIPMSSPLYTWSYLQFYKSDPCILKVARLSQLLIIWLGVVGGLRAGNGVVLGRVDLLEDTVMHSCHAAPHRSRVYLWRVLLTSMEKPDS